MDDLMYLGEDARTEHVIAETLVRLPSVVREFALARCVFISIGWAASGITLPGSVGVDPASRRSRNVWLIVLEERAPRDLLASVVAHEVAHAWLHHDRLSDELPQDHEVRAAELAHRWGFSGRPADPAFWQRKLDRERTASDAERQVHPHVVELTQDPSASVTS
jgi:hypothetical protein